jgi:hypothetical protein
VTTEICGCFPLIRRSADDRRLRCYPVSPMMASAEANVGRIHFVKRAHRRGKVANLWREQGSCFSRGGAKAAMGQCPDPTPFLSMISFKGRILSFLPRPGSGPPGIPADERMRRQSRAVGSLSRGPLSVCSINYHPSVAGAPARRSLAPPTACPVALPLFARMLAREDSGARNGCANLPNYATHCLAVCR